MEVSTDVEQNNSVADEVATLARNRSFKTKHLVRSQALRETQSPPRTMSPSQLKVTQTLTEVTESDNGSDRTLCDDVSSQVNECHSVFSDSCNNNISDDSDEFKKGPVEIQITTGAWESEVPATVPAAPCERARWSGRRGLFAHEPRVSCVCVVEARRCDYCRGRRPKLGCSSKQDSGIVCSDECPECSDCEINEPSPPTSTKCDSVEADTEEQTSCSCPDRKDIPKNSCLIRGDSDDRYAPTGTDLVNFIKETLNKNPKDRIALLRIEKELHGLVSDSGRFLIRFPVMTSYGRMLVHRCAALFQLSHNIDVYNKCAVVVSKNGTSGGCIPCTSFRAWCTTKFPPIAATLETQTKFILKRDANSLDDTNSIGGAGNSLRSKSLEQREREYERVRRRIFSNDNCHPDDNRWWCGNGPVKLYTSDNGKSKLIKVQSLESSTPTPSYRGSVAKSHSFGGYEPPPRLLSRQGDLALSSWRLSPSSSGYKTLSFRSTESVTPSPTGGVSPEPSAQNTERSLMWAITEMSSVPEGSLIIHPTTCQPLRNADGTVYHYDPANPPVIDNTEEEDKSDQNSEKKRGRLEKQHCFVDLEYECQVEDCRNKQFVHLDWAAEVAAENNNCAQCPDGETETTLTPEPLVANQAESPPTDEIHEVQSSEVAVNEDIAPPEQPEQECEQNGAVYVEDGANGAMIGPPEEAQPSPPQEVSAEDETAAVAITYEDNTTGPTHEYSAPANQATYSHNNCRSEPQFRIDPSYQQYAELQAGFVPATTYMPPFHHPHVASCAGCPIDQITGLAHCRGYPMPYGQPLEAATMVPHTYPMGNVLLQQQSVPSFPYPPPPLHWQPNLPPIITPGLPSNCPTPNQKPTSPPNLFLPTQEVQMYHPAPVNYQKQQDLVNYPMNNQVYPLVQYQYPYNYPVVTPVVPQYQYCPQLYPVTDKPDQGRNSGVRSYESMQRFNSQMNSTSGSSRTTPIGGTPPAPEVKLVTHEQYDPRRLGRQASLTESNVQADNRRRPFNRNNSARSDVSQPTVADFAGQLQQLNDRMAHLSTDGHRNRNPGILGSYPHNNAPNRYINYHRIEHDESQLSTAARAVVDSIRSLPPKNFHNYYHHDNSRRNDHFQRYQFRQNRSYDGFQRRDGRRGDDHAKGSREKIENVVESNTEHKQLAPKEQNGAAAVQPNNFPQNGQARFDYQQSRNRNFTTYYRTSQTFRQVSGWPRRSPGPQAAFNHQRRPPPEKRNE